MTDIERTVRAELRNLAGGVGPGWSGIDPDAVIARHRRVRRTRAAVLAVTAAVVVVVGAPTVLAARSPSSAPGVQVAGPGGNLTAAERAQAEAELAAVSSAQMQAMGECMIDAGWKMTMAGGSVSLSSTFRDARQAADYRADLATCTKAAAASRPVLSETALRVAYAGYRAVHDCLEAKGYTPEEPVDEASFVAAQGRNWSPHIGIAQEQLATAMDNCPW